MSDEARHEGNGGIVVSRSGSQAILIGVVVVVVVAVALAFGLGWGKSSDDGGSGNGGGDGIGSGEAQPVTVVGEALADLPKSGGDPAVGMPAPTLEGFGFDGSALNIVPGADGKPIMIAFLAHWCPHCNYQLPQLVEWIDSGRVPDGLQIYAVATSMRRTGANFPPSSWFENNNWDGLVLADSTSMDAAVAYGLTGLPFMVVLDGDGNVAKRFSGETSAADVDKYVRAALRQP